MNAVAEMLTNKFGAALRTHISPDEMDEVITSNQGETNPGICHSHDFCDANVVLYEVFISHCIDVADEGGIARWGQLWGKVWNRAKAQGFRSN